MDTSIGLTVPDAVKKLTAVYENLRSETLKTGRTLPIAADGSLQDLADAIFPVQIEPRIRNVDGKDKEIGLGTDQYVNRLMAYVEDSSTSDRFNEIVGSHLRYMGERLDALFGAAQKGSHSTVTREEAERCAVYTYLLVGDVLSLRKPSPIPASPVPELDIFTSVVEERKNRRKHRYNQTDFLNRPTKGLCHRAHPNSRGRRNILRPPASGPGVRRGH